MTNKLGYFNALKAPPLEGGGGGFLQIIDY